MGQERKRRISKPVGVYVLTIIIVLGLGVLQFAKYFIEIKYSDEPIPLPIVFISFFVCAFSAGAAIWAFYGNNLARVVLLTFVTMNVGWLVFLTITAVSYAQDLNAFGLIVQLIRPVFWLVLTWWYFTKPDVVAYYKQRSELSVNE